MATRAEKEAAKLKQDEEAKRVEAERAKGTADLAAHNQAQSQLSDKERAAADQKAREEADKAAAEESKRATAAQKEASKKVAELPPGTRVFKAGTKFQLNGEDVVAATDVAMVVQNGDHEQHVASLLARDPENHRINESLLRLQYNPMNGTPLALSAQRLSPEEMTPSERAVFGIKD
jgi:hypothetical protein